MITLQAKQGERGAAALSLLTVAMIIALAIFAVMAIPLTQASDAKAKSNSAADAAALAGVDFVRGDLISALATQGWLGSWEAYAGLGTGRAAAETYADRNDATLTAYSFSVATFEAYAKVRGRSVDGQPTQSEATAKLDLPVCTTEIDDTPEPEPTPPPADDPPPPPPPPKPVKFRCAGIGIDIVINPTEDDPGRLPLPAAVIDALLNGSNAKLVS